MLRFISNIAVSVFAVIVGLKMWFTTDGVLTFIALIIILIGVSALESNVSSVLKSRHNKEAGRAGTSGKVNAA